MVANYIQQAIPRHLSQDGDQVSLVQLRDLSVQGQASKIDHCQASGMLLITN